jgi:hypothetical protein
MDGSHSIRPEVRCFLKKLLRRQGLQEVSLLRHRTACPFPARYCRDSRTHFHPCSGRQSGSVLPIRRHPETGDDGWRDSGHTKPPVGMVRLRAGCRNRPKLVKGRATANAKDVLEDARSRYAVGIVERAVLHLPGVPYLRRMVLRRSALERRLRSKSRMSFHISSVNRMPSTALIWANPVRPMVTLPEDFRERWGTLFHPPILSYRGRSRPLYGCPANSCWAR